jgi:murein DD-endopeptidase MepM/ murein hydrolase activator NlpD
VTRRLLIGLAAAVLAIPAAAEVLELDGSLVQGGLVVGRVAPGTAVTVDGRAVRVSEDGRFLIGFGRDARTALVHATPPGGGAITRTLWVRTRTYDVQRIDGLPPKQVTPDAKTLQRIEAEKRLIVEARARDRAAFDFARGFAWPAVGRISGVFGSQRILNGEPRAPHLGVDVSAPEGASVAATADGVVTLAHDDLFFTGKTVILDHGHGLTSSYAHLSAITVKPGERVARGQIIGRIGATGRVTGPHLHWGMHLLGVGLDPALLVGPMPESGQALESVRAPPRRTGSD